MDNTSYIYVLAALVGLIVFVILYSVLVPKRKRRFSPDNAEESNGNYALRALTILSSEIYGALPSTGNERARTKNERKLIRIEELIVKSGNPWGLKADEFAFIRYVTALIGGIFGAMIWFAMFVFGFLLPWWVVVAAFIVLGFFYPDIHYREKAAERDLDFKKNLPEALDLMRISVKAGRSLNQAFRDTVPHLKESHLRTELTSVINSVDSGKTLKDALDDFANRAPSTGIVTFTRALQEVVELDVSPEQAIKSRSDESRAELYSLIRERTAALPVKMTAVLTPTLSFALMIVLLAPFVTSLMQILQ